MDRLYIITRSDLSPGLQVAQSCHALQAFNVQHKAAVARWAGNLVCLSVPDAATLGTLACELGHRYRVATFHEPDLDGELTAIAVEGSAGRLLSSLPLALRDRPLEIAA